MAILGKGTKIGYAATAEGTPTELAEVFKVTPPVDKTGRVKTTHYGSTGPYHDTIAEGFTENPTCEVEANYTKAQRAALSTIKDVVKYWTITYPDNSTEKFQGRVIEISADVPNEDKITNKCVIELTTAPVFAAAA